MSQHDILSLLNAVRDGKLSPEDAITKLKLEPFQDLGYAKVDHHRELRQGVSEVIYGAGKTPEQIIGIAQAMRSHGQERILITRIDAGTAALIQNAVPMRYEAQARFGLIGEMPEPDGDGTVVIACGGTSARPGGGGRPET